MNMKSDAPHTGDGRGPYPLGLHIGLAMAEYNRLLQCGHADDVSLKAMLHGIRCYQSHSFKRLAPKYEKIWGEGQVSLLRHADQKKTGYPVLLVPSLINRSAILDLLPGRSFMRYLARKGLDPVLLDWGEPVRDQGMQDCERLIAERLAPALRYLHGKTGMPVHALGYCMGGVLLVRALESAGEHVGRIALLGSPWDFHAGDRKMLSHIAAGSPMALQSMAERGYLPQAWIQSVFATMNADGAAEKFAAFASMKPDGFQARLFIAVEDWLNDGVDLPLGLARTCICDWYGENCLVSCNLKMPHEALIIAARKDRLVPRESALAIANVFDRAHILTPDTGHIGMIAGRAALPDVWNPVRQWFLGADFSCDPGIAQTCGL